MLEKNTDAPAFGTLSLITILINWMRFCKGVQTPASEMRTEILL
jgi:hypothetical protein